MTAQNLEREKTGKKGAESEYDPRERLRELQRSSLDLVVSPSGTVELSKERGKLNEIYCEYLREAQHVKGLDGTSDD